MRQPSQREQIRHKHNQEANNNIQMNVVSSMLRADLEQKYCIAHIIIILNERKTSESEWKEKTRERKRKTFFFYF